MPLLATIEGPDILSDVLATLRLRGRLFCRSELSAPWSLSLSPGDYAHFHLIERGEGLLRHSGTSASVPLSRGDFVLLPRGEGHILASDEQTLPVGIGALTSSAPRSAACATVRHGGGGAESVVVCGSFRVEGRESYPLLSLLPPLLLLRGRAGEDRTSDWLQTTLRFLADEAQHPTPGTDTLSGRLTDVLFVQALRAWIEREPEGVGGWLGALRDPQIARALAGMHRAPEERWTVSSLALLAGMSRSAFAARFTELVGEAPLAYVTRWRMHLATDLLRHRRLSVTEVATRVGYESEAAFSKAFKRQTGQPPGQLRRSLKPEAAIV